MASSEKNALTLIVLDLLEARYVIMNRQLDYNTNRLHSSLNNITPTKFRENYENNVDSKLVSLQVV
ncbi:integrase core domain-containing protein [Patescibacteria group bacterium]|nr:integrase core domain-containing protein [Patescibacteria group bacterium]